MVDATRALPGRDTPMPVPERHFVNGNPLAPPYPEGLEQAMFGLGCFWGAERKFWEADGVWVTAVGYAAGITPNPTYEEVCSGRTGHGEVVLVVFDPEKITYAELLKIFWESHDPTQGMRQGNDVGTQYRSGIYTFSDAQLAAGRGVTGRVPEGVVGGRVTARSRPRSSRRRPSTSPRTTTSSTWPRTRWATAASAAPASAAPPARTCSPERGLVLASFTCVYRT